MKKWQTRWESRGQQRAAEALLMLGLCIPISACVAGTGKPDVAEPVLSARYVVDLTSANDGDGSKFEPHELDNAFVEGELLVEVVRDRVIGHIRGTRSRGLSQFYVPLEGEVTEAGTIRLVGYAGSDNALLEAELVDGSLRGSVNGAALKRPYAFDFDVSPAVTTDGKYPCLGAVCDDACTQTSCGPGESCSSATTNTPKVCMSDFDDSKDVLVFVSSTAACDQQLIEGRPAPGVEIGDVVLRSSEGTSARATAFGAQPGAMPNAFAAAASFGELSCDGVGYSLGCGGAFLAVEFFDANGLPITIASSMTVDLEVCGDTGGQSFDVLLCGRRPFDLSTCSALGEELNESATLVVP